MQAHSTPLLKVELHLHSSEDPLDNLPLDPVRTLERAAKLGFDAVAFTHHEKAMIPDERLRDAERRTGVLVIPGIEASLDDGGHVIILGCGAEAEAFRTLEELEAQRRPGYCIIAPHPYYPGPSIGHAVDLERWAHLFDAVEWCHFWHPRLATRNRRAARYARRHGLPIVGTGDVHLPDQMGHTYTLVAAKERSVDGILAAVREGACHPVTRPLSLTRMAWIGFRMVLWNRVLNLRYHRKVLRKVLPGRRRAGAASSSEERTLQPLRPSA